MKVLSVHTYYQQRGGEDQVFEREADLLADAGHDVVRFTRHNDDVLAMGRIELAGRTLWNAGVADEIRTVLRQFKPDVLHAHNVFPVLSPAIYYTAKSEGVPVVQTLHNFRLRCANGLFLRNSAVCTDCLERAFAWPAIIHRCYRNDRGASAVTVAMQVLHNSLGTWRNKVDRFIALTASSKALLVRGGLPAEKIAVKGNFLTDPGAPDPNRPRAGALFVGRLSEEKGVDTMIDAWPDIDVQLSVIGDGDLGPTLRQRASSNVQFLGSQPRDAVIRAMRRAAFLVLPSICFENFPLVICEAFACGVPVVTTRHGAMQELVSDRDVGLLFEPASARDLTTKVRWAAAHPTEMRRMGLAARQRYESQYTPETNVRRLLEIYQETIKTPKQPEDGLSRPTGT